MPSTESNGQTVEGILIGLRARRRLLNVARWSVNGLLAGPVVGIAAALLVWAIANPGTLGLVAAGAIGIVATLVLMIVVGWCAPVQDLEVARALDRAASGQDQFASAVQLAGHAKQERARLLVEDALSRVSRVTPQAAMPLALPRTARWIPVPLIALCVLVVLLPSGQLQAEIPEEPEITASEWSEIHEDFRKQMEQMPKPLTPDEEELAKQLEQLASMLAQNPDKKDALKEIARLSDRVAERKKALGANANSLKNAAKAMAASQSLKQFASTMKEGDYDKASENLEELSKKLETGEQKPDAEEMEAMASDLQKMAELVSQDKMQSACKNAADAASTMDREALAKALKRLAEQMKENAGQCKQGDNMSEYEKALERLKRQMNQGKRPGKKPGDGFGEQPGRGSGKGGEKAGWGTAAIWDGGSLRKRRDTKTPEMVDPAEQGGLNTTFKIVSPDENATSDLKYKEMYAEFVQKSEADLDLESVPVAYREYLRRYFNSIRPAEPEPAPAEPAKP